MVAEADFNRCIDAMEALTINASIINDPIECEVMEPATDEEIVE